MDPVLIPGVTHVKFRGLHYQDATLHISYDANNVTIWADQPTLLIADDRYTTVGQVCM